jgi:hypothetical protein
LYYSSPVGPKFIGSVIDNLLFLLALVNKLSLAFSFTTILQSSEMFFKTKSEKEDFTIISFNFTSSFEII